MRKLLHLFIEILALKESSLRRSSGAVEFFFIHTIQNLQIVAFLTNSANNAHPMFARHSEWHPEDKQDERKPC